MSKCFFTLVILCIFTILLFGCNPQNDLEYGEQEEILIDMQITSEKDTFSIKETGEIIVKLENKNTETLCFGSSLGELLGFLEKKDDTGWQTITIDNIVFPDLVQINSGEQKEFVINTSGVISSFGEYRFVVPYQIKKQLIKEIQARDAITNSSKITDSPIYYSYYHFFVNE